MAGRERCGTPAGGDPSGRVPQEDSRAAGGALLPRRPGSARLPGAARGYCRGAWTIGKVIDDG